MKQVYINKIEYFLPPLKESNKSVLKLSGRNETDIKKMIDKNSNVYEEFHTLHRKCGCHRTTPTYYFEGLKSFSILENSERESDTFVFLD